MSEDNRIAVVGLGYVGLPLALAMVDAGGRARGQGPALDRRRLGWVWGAGSGRPGQCTRPGVPAEPKSVGGVLDTCYISQHRRIPA